MLTWVRHSCSFQLLPRAGNQDTHKDPFVGSPKYYPGTVRTRQLYPGTITRVAFG
ncbi:hypothetical protein BGZ63DRAFT_371004 [Mariannaea sp. PMI_226]|nr:hypothetical protein BGZ63DRAFT_371004 [Mariannaea sp. PMI_226]